MREQKRRITVLASISSNLLDRLISSPQNFLYFCGFPPFLQSNPAVQVTAIPSHIFYRMRRFLGTSYGWVIFIPDAAALNDIQYTKFWLCCCDTGRAWGVRSRIIARGFFYPEDGGVTFLRNVGLHKIYSAPQPRRRHSSTYIKINLWIL
jgi:hypothetical protein